MNKQDREQMELGAAGGEPVERGGADIWQSPDNGFSYAQEMSAKGRDPTCPNASKEEQ